MSLLKVLGVPRCKICIAHVLKNSDMILHLKNNLQFYSEIRIEPPKLPSSPNPLPFIIILMITIITLGIVYMGKKPFIEYDSEGNPKLAEWRKEKLIKELDDFESAEQYVLFASMSGVFPCYSCVGKKTIYLHTGQIWKYGITTKSQSGRYTNNWLEKMNLKYQIQFEGTIPECLREERIKIYSYAIHPENIIRKKPLIRPPGNKNDS